jgi:hypothetical protein
LNALVRNRISDHLNKMIILGLAILVWRINNVNNG